MDLYFSPLSSSMAARIALDEAGIAARFIEVDPYTHQLIEGGELSALAPLALVPVLRTDQGQLITENAAVLQYVAGLAPEAGLAPTGGAALVDLHRWLSFIGTELHKVVFASFFDRRAPREAREYGLSKAPTRLAVLDAHLQGQEFLLDRFSVADAYLITVLNWTAATTIDLTRWPALAGYAARLRARPSVARALAIETPLYLAEQKRHA